MVFNQESTATDGFGLLHQAGYEIRDMLVSSAIGQRYRIIRRSDGQSFLALVINQGWLHDARFREYYRNFSDWSKSISIPSIAALHAVINDQQNIAYVYQDDYSLQNLRSVLHPNKTLFPDFVLRVLRQIISAMATAADKGLTHGGLCPEILRINPHSAVLIDDFFVLKSPQSLLMGVVEGNDIDPKLRGHYFAPEHFIPNARYDIQTDMFLIGLILYRMLIGKDCIVGVTPPDGMSDFQSRQPPSLSAIRPELVRQFDTLFQRLVAVEKNRRPQSYEEISSLIEHVEQAIRARELSESQSSYTPFGNEIIERPAPSTSYYRKPAVITNRIYRETTTTRHRIMANNVVLPAPLIVTGTETIRRLQPARYVAGSGTLIMAGLIIVLLAGYIIFSAVKKITPVVVQATEKSVLSVAERSDRTQPILAATPDIDLSKIPKPTWMIPPGANNSANLASSEATERKADSVDLVEAQSVEQQSLTSIKLMRDGFFARR